MKLNDIYRLAVSMGKTYDIRGTYLEEVMEKKLQEYENLNNEEKLLYDTEALSNPFNDTRILIGTGEEEIKTILCGIDMETSELLLADRLNEKGFKIDLVMAHHPEGVAEAELHQVMYLQADMLEKMGVPINIGEGIMVPRIKEVQRGRMPLNHQRAVDAARLLGLLYMCVHTAADNLANNYLQTLLDEENYSTVGDIIDILHKIPEYQQARKLKAGPQIIMGNSSRRAGKVFVKFTGGTAGSEKSYEKLAQAGVGTVVCMHMPDKHRAAARDNNLNVIIAGHMASDSLGLNIFLDEIEKKGVEVIPCSGLIRVKRFADHEYH